MIVCIVSDGNGDDIVRYEARDGETLVDLACRVATDIAATLPNMVLSWRFRREKQSKNMWKPPKDWWENRVPLRERVSFQESA